MTHWLDKAELETHMQRQQPAHTRTVQDQDALCRINENYTANRVAYEDFILILNCYCRRVNQLPAEYRAPWFYLDAQTKNTKLESHPYSFSSCERFDKIVPSLGFPFVKWRHYKHLRELVFTVSQEMGKCEIAVREDYLAKIRVKNGNHLYSSNYSDNGHMSANQIFSFTIGDTSWRTAIKVLDWLTFKTDLKLLPFYEKSCAINYRTENEWPAHFQNWRHSKIQNSEAAFRH